MVSIKNLKIMSYFVFLSGFILIGKMFLNGNSHVQVNTNVDIYMYTYMYGVN